ARGRLERRARAFAPRSVETAVVQGPRAIPPRRAQAAPRAALSGLPPAPRAARGRLADTLARAALRGDRSGARLRPCGAGAVGRPPPLRKPADARAAPAVP